MCYILVCELSLRGEELRSDSDFINTGANTTDCVGGIRLK
jgi:hypothetical protein